MVRESFYSSALDTISLFAAVNDPLAWIVQVGFLSMEGVPVGVLPAVRWLSAWVAALATS